MGKKPFRFPYMGSVTEGYITGKYGHKLLIDGTNDSKGLYFIKEGSKVTTFSNRKLAQDSCECGATDNWGWDEYQHNHPITGGPPEYHAGISQSTQAPKTYPGATEADLHNSIAGIDEGGLQHYNPESQIIHDADGGPGSGQKGHTSQAPEHGGSHTRMTASPPSGAGKRFQSFVSGHPEAMKRLQSLRANPETRGHHVTLQHPSGRTHTVRSHEHDIPSHFFGNQ